MSSFVNPITSSTEQLNRRQEEHAAQIISRGIDATEKTGTGITAATARIIAATLHGGQGSTVERFAATGVLDVDLALAELDHGLVNQHQVPWVTALLDFLERRTATSPDELVDAHNDGAPGRVA